MLNLALVQSRPGPGTGVGAEGVHEVAAKHCDKDARMGNQKLEVHTVRPGQGAKGQPDPGFSGDAWHRNSITILVLYTDH